MAYVARYIIEPTVYGNMPFVVKNAQGIVISRHRTVEAAEKFVRQKGATATKNKRNKSRAACKAESRAGKCLIYHKVHTEQRAAAGHLRNLKKRGATVKVTKSGGKIKIDYSFPKKR